LKINTNGQLIHEEMLNILGNKGSANQNDAEVSPHYSQNGYLPSITHTKTNAGEDAGKRNFHTLLVGM
jgi:hypothetical protein